MSFPVQSYSRSNNIALFICSVKELFKLCKQFKPKEMGELFLVRTKIMEMLAQQAFKYSIAVNYLKDNEYHAVADTLDNVYLHQSRMNVRNMASQYGSLVTREYESMREALDLIDERLKTVKVVCYKPRNRKFVTKKSNAKRSLNNQLVKECKKPLNPLAKEWVPKKPLNPLAEEWVPKSSNQIKTEKTQEEKEHDNKCDRFNKKVNTWLLTLQELKTVNTIDSEIKFTMQCEHLTAMLNFIIDNNDILKTPRYNKAPSNTTNKLGVVKTLMLKSVELTNEINNMYDIFRSKKQRANPSMRSIKIKTLNSIKHVQKILKIINDSYESTVH